jgi:predicted aspartyl protease
MWVGTCGALSSSLLQTRADHHAEGVQVAAIHMRGKATNQQNPRTTRIRFRINRTGNLIVVQAIINGKGPYDMIVDTGASTTLITPIVARRTGVRMDGATAKATGANGNTTATLARSNSFALGSIEVKNLQVAVMSLTAVSRATGLRVGGVIGFNFLKHFRVTIDYSARAMWLEASRAPKTRGGARGPASLL